MVRQTFANIAGAILATMILGACVSSSELPPRSAATAGPAPVLLPISDVQRMAAGGSDVAQITASTETRANALRARAARLRGPVITAGDRQSLLASAVTTQG